MALVRSILGTQFSQRQGQMTQKNNKKCLPRRFKCGFQGSPSPYDNKRREKYTPKIEVALKSPKKSNMQANKPYIWTGLRHIFRIVSSQLSTMMEPSNAILEHETTNGDKKSAQVTEVSYPVFLLSTGKHIKLTKKKGKYYHCIQKIPYIVQMFII